ncbi:hypothetical protein C7S16_6329 [Burkholderia thailandensis]|uniref:Uncharacterized protein n=1 Tax=Burkholderia thailandensis TaxID=57975 RepID=A0AAW9CNL8_BURTH|nr:hypothetical protein [Burkholderia thailandensis]MDW9252230.1 hypothetical protein [Burkholderia thailandensis]
MTEPFPRPAPDALARSSRVIPCERPRGLATLARPPIPMDRRPPPAQNGGAAVPRSAARRGCIVQIGKASS